MGDTSIVTAVTGETIQLYYSNSGTRTADAGQAAGTKVSGNTLYSGITNKAGDTQATTRDSSLTFTSTAFTTLKFLSYQDMEAMDEMSFAERLAYVASAASNVFLSANGDYCVDYRKGTLYGIKASTQSTLTSAAYSYQSHVSTATIAGSVAVTSVVPGTGATNLGKAEDAIAASGDVGVASLAVRNDAGTALAADGDYTFLQTDSTGALRTSATLSLTTDDGAFTPAVSGGIVAMGFADETASDVVNEGDAGALRMTLDRRLITAGQILDDAAFTPAASYATPAAGVYQASPDSVDDGDAGALRMTINRKLISASETADDAAPETGFLPSVIGAVADETAADSVDEGDAGYVRMDLARNLRVTDQALRGPGLPVIDSYQQVAINLTTGADQVLVASAANKQIWVYGYAFTCGDAAGQTVSLQDEDNVALTGIMEFAQYGGIAVSPSGNFSMPVFKLGTDKDLEIDITGGDVDGWLTYSLVSV